MPSSEDEEVEGVAADAFTPVKTAVRDLVEECWSPPVRTSRAACTQRYAASKDLLGACGISLRTPVGDLKSLAQAVTEIAVAFDEEGLEKVPKELDFLFQLDGKAKKDWVTSSKGFKARVEEVIRLSKAAVTPRPRKAARTGDKSGAVTSDGGVTEAPDSSGYESRATSDGGVTEAHSGSEGDESDVS